MSTLQLSPEPVHSEPAEDTWEAAHAAWREGFDDSNPPAEPDFEPDWDALADLAEAQDRYESGCLF